MPQKDPLCPPWSGQRTPTPTDGPSQNVVALAIPDEAYMAYALGNKAIAATAAAYSNQGRTNNAADAYRHFYWSFTMTTDLGAGVAEVVGTSHEQNPDTADGHYMDYYNNAVARWAAQQRAYQAMSPAQAASTALSHGCLKTKP